MTRTSRTAVSLAASVAGAVLLVWYLRRIGVDRIWAGLAAVGVGFAGILALSLARFALRAVAWTTLIGQRVPIGRALAATIGGDALGQLTPLSVLVSEPAKALFLDRDVEAGRGLAALAAENFFYGVSITTYIMLGAAAMLEAYPVPPALRLAGVWALVMTAAALLTAGWLAWQKPSLAGATLGRLPVARLRHVIARLREFETRTYGSAGQQGGRLASVFACEALFHTLSFVEAWFTIWLLTGASRPLEAFVLDAFSRFSNIVFRIVPLRLGVDQAGSGLVADAVGLDPVTGATLSLVRTGRLIVWAAVGLGLVATRRGLTPPAERRV
jgi:hypothetical protein